MKWITIILLGLYTVQCQHEHKTETFQSKHKTTAFQINGGNGELFAVQQLCRCKTEQHTAANQDPGRNFKPQVVCSCQNCVANSTDQHGNPVYHCSDSVDTASENLEIPQNNLFSGTLRFFNEPEFSQMQAQYQQPMHQQFLAPMLQNYQPPFHQYQQQSNFLQPDLQQLNFQRPYSHQQKFQQPNSHQTNFQQQQYPQQHHSHRQKRTPFDWDNFFDKISLMGSHDGTYNKRTHGYFHYNYLGGNKGNEGNVSPDPTPTQAPQTATT